MIRNTLKTFSCITMTLFSLNAFAEEKIKITVKTNEKTAAGIGYSVAGRDLGGLGKTYSGKGPTNKKYVFGYRKHSIYGSNVTCGEQILTKDSTIILVTQGDKCQIVID